MLDYDHAPIPELLRAWRTALGLSQERAATALATPVATLREWEYGRRRPKPDGPLRIALKAVAAERR